MYFSFQLAERLGKTQAEIMSMGAEELQNWVAFSSLQNEEYRKTIENKIHLEKQDKMTQAELTAQLRALLGGIR